MTTGPEALDSPLAAAPVYVLGVTAVVVVIGTGIFGDPLARSLVVGLAVGVGYAVLQLVGRGD